MALGSLDNRGTHVMGLHPVFAVIKDDARVSRQWRFRGRSASNSSPMVCVSPASDGRKVSAPDFPSIHTTCKEALIMKPKSSFNAGAADRSQPRPQRWQWFCPAALQPHRLPKAQPALRRKQSPWFPQSRAVRSWR